MACSFAEAVYTGLCGAPILYVAALHFCFLVRGQLGLPRGVGGTYKRLAERPGAMRPFWARTFDLHRCFDVCSHFVLALTYLRQVIMCFSSSDALSHGLRSTGHGVLLVVLFLGHLISGTLHAGKYMQTPPWLQRAALTQAADVLDCSSHSCSGILYLNADMRAWSFVVFMADMWFRFLAYYEAATQDVKENTSATACSEAEPARPVKTQKNTAQATAAGCTNRRSASSFRARKCRTVG